MLKWNQSIAHTATQLQLLKRKPTLPNYSKRTFDDLLLLKFLAGLERRLAPSMLARTSTLLCQMLRFPAPVSKGFSCTNFRSHVVQQIGQPRSNTSGSLNIRICLTLRWFPNLPSGSPHCDELFSGCRVNTNRGV